MDFLLQVNSISQCVERHRYSLIPDSYWILIVSKNRSPRTNVNEHKYGDKLAVHSVKLDNNFDTIEIKFDQVCNALLLIAKAS